VRWGRETAGLLAAGRGCLLDAEHTGLRQPPLLFGLDLIEGIPDHAIMANADPDDADGDGIAGRPISTAG
jgi:CxxC motif-containing protein (DUF1111 family)